MREKLRKEMLYSGPRAGSTPKLASLDKNLIRKRARRRWCRQLV